MRFHQTLGVVFPIDDPVWIADLVLQRTGPINTLGGQSALLEWLRSGDRAPLEALCSDESFVVKYLDIVAAEAFNEAVPLYSYLGGDRRVCSIGPGNGLVELFLSLNAGVAELLLVDIEKTAEHAHGFERKGSGYASLEKTKEFLMANGISADKIYLCNPQQVSLPSFKFDLLISIMSMGFHYPCDEYVSFIQKNCARPGRVIFDKRRGVPDAGFEELLTDFSSALVSENHKWQRVMLTR